MVEGLSQPVKGRSTCSDDLMSVKLSCSSVKLSFVTSLSKVMKLDKIMVSPTNMGSVPLRRLSEGMSDFIVAE